MVVKISGRVMSIKPFKGKNGNFKEVQILTGEKGTDYELMALCMGEDERIPEVGQEIKDQLASVSIYQGKLKAWSKTPRKA